MGSLRRKTRTSKRFPRVPWKGARWPERWREHRGNLVEVGGPFGPFPKGGTPSSRHPWALCGNGVAVLEEEVARLSKAAWKAVGRTREISVTSQEGNQHDIGMSCYFYRSAASTISLARRRAAPEDRIDMCVSSYPCTLAASAFASGRSSLATLTVPSFSAGITAERLARWL